MKMVSFILFNITLGLLVEVENQLEIIREAEQKLKKQKETALQKEGNTENTEKKQCPKKEQRNEDIKSFYIYFIEQITQKRI